MAYNTRPSRLKRLEERRAVKSTAFYIVLTVAAVGLLAIFGVPALSKLTSLTGNITRSGVDYTANTPPPPPPAINTLPKNTNQDKLKVTGTTKAGQNVIIFFNNDKTEVLANANGEFTSVFDLSLGENSLYAQVEDNRGQKSTETDKFTVVLDKTEPVLELISPENGKSLFGQNQKNIQIEGQSEQHARVTINDRIAIVRSDGKFNFPVTLQGGENIFKIVATDEAGNKTELELKLTYAQ